MAVVGASILKDLVRKYKVVNPSSEANFDGDGYVLTVREDRTLNYLEHRNVVSNEVVFVPPDFVAHLSAKSKYGRLGLSFLNSVKVHSGFVGRLVLELVNLSNERTSITIKRGDPFMHIEFLRREGEPSPYSGRYMFQYMNDSEMEVYAEILSKNYRGLFPKNRIAEIRRNRLTSEEES